MGFSPEIIRALEHLEKKKKIKGYIKLRNYFIEITKRKDFEEEILKMRKKYKIPIKGMSRENNKEFLEWVNKHHDLYVNDIDTDIRLLAKKFYLPNKPGEIIKAIVECLLHNTPDNPENYQFKSPNSNLFVIEETRKKEDFYPIIIKISPYASQRDIIDFVKTVYTYEILPKQIKRRDKRCLIGKIKSKKPRNQERNSIIFKNKHLSIKEIKNILKKEGFPLLGYEEIFKIISIERKRRKDV